MKVKIKADSTLMKNQKHADVMKQQGTFQALQTQEGHALFFSIGTDNALHLTREVPGDATGWKQTDISGSLGKSAKHFVVSQNMETNTVDIVLAVKSDTQDAIYTALGINNTDETWEKPITWKAAPYDNPRTVQKLEIVGLYTAPVSGSNLTMVDIIQDQASVNKFVYRYLLDPEKKKNKKVWNKSPLAVNVSAGDVTCSVGRKYGERIDGVYTFGLMDKTRILVYTPVMNVNVADTELQAPITRLMTPPDAEAVAVSLIEGDKNSTNVFVAGSGRLYYFDRKKQSDGSSGQLIMTHPLLKNIVQLDTNTDATHVYVWGLNKQGKIFYMKCALGEENNTFSWSIPIPILSNVTRIATYLNFKHSGNVIFAHSDKVLIQLTQDPNTSLWTTRKIVLPATSPNNPPIEFNSFTTHISVLDENNKAVDNQKVAITSASPVSVYVNNAFEILTPDNPLTVTTDAKGTITILQETESISGVCYDLKAEGSPDTVTVNPMTKTMEKLSEIQSADDLNKVKVKNADGSEKPLVDSSISAESRESTANAIKQFVETGNKLPKNGRRMLHANNAPTLKNYKASTFTVSKSTIWGMSFENGESTYFAGHEAMLQLGLVHDTTTDKFALRNNSVQVGDVGNAIKATAGDIFNWLKDAFNSVANFFTQVIGGVTHFFITIANELYTFIIDCVEKVVSAVEFVFNKIKVFIEDIIKWIGFLFQWKDILATSKVMKTVYIRQIENAVSTVTGAKGSIHSAFVDLQDAMNKWADLPSVSQTPDQTSKAVGTTKGMDSAESNYGVYQLDSNAGGIQSSSMLTTSVDPAIENLLKAFSDLLEKELGTFSAAFTKIKTEIIDKFGSLSIGDIMKKFVTIVATTLIQATEHVLVACIDIIAALADGLTRLIQTPLHIPVLSWLYGLITGGEDLTFLDVMCLVSAIPATLLFKIIENRAPFPSGSDFTKKLCAAKDTSEIQTILKSDKDYLRSFMIVSGYYAAIGSVVMTICAVLKAPFEAAEQDAPFWLKRLNAAAVSAYLAPKRVAVLMRKDSPNAFEKMDYILTDLYMLKDTVLGCNSKAGSKTAKVNQWLDFTFHLIWNIPAVAAIVNNKDDKDSSLIPDTIANFSFNLSGMMAPIPDLMKTPESKAIAYGVKYGLGISYGALSPVVWNLKAAGIK